MRTKLFILVMLISSQLVAQKGALKGVVRTSDGNPAPFVKVSLKRLNKGDVSKDDGTYRIGNITPGEYEAVAYLNGLNKVVQKVTISANETTEHDFKLEESMKTYEEVVVQGVYRNRYHRSQNNTVAKMPLKQIENPQVYQSVPKELLEEQVATTVEQGLKNATGVTQLWESTGRSGDGAAYYTMRGFSVQPTLVNGVPNLTSAGLDPANIETIDVIKGPSGTLFGSAVISYGGLINITTKKPFEQFGGSVGYVAGNFGQNRLTLDINNPLSENASMRIVGAYDKRAHFQDAGGGESFFLAPSFSFEASDKWRFVINTEIREAESVNAPMIFLNRNAPLTTNSMELFEQNYRNSYTSEDLSMRNPSYGIQAQSYYEISDNWTSQTILSSNVTQQDGYYHYLFAQDGQAQNYSRFISYQKGENRTLDVQQNFIGNFDIGFIENKLVAGIDYYRSEQQTSSSSWVANGTVNLNSQEDTGDLTRSGVDDLLAGNFAGNMMGSTEVMSAYVSDVMNFTDKLSAMASVRVDNFRNSSDVWKEEQPDGQFAISPKFGAVYQIIEDELSIFSNYMNGFSNIAPQQVADADGSNVRFELFDPEQANQYEAGLKTDIFNKRLALSASYYNITVSNKLMQDPDNVNNKIQRGEVESSGIEISLTANPVDGLNIIAGASYNESKVTEDNPDAGYLNMRPEEAGPANLYNYWVSYTLPAGILKGFGIGVGGNAAGQHLTLNRDNIGTFALPAYHIVDGSLFYRTERVSINLKVNNVTNDYYYSGWSTITPQMLRSVSIGLNYNF